VSYPATIHIRVYGEPQPFPKKDVAIVKGRLIPVDHDYRTRKNPLTGKTEKHHRGYKRQWMALVSQTVASYMLQHDIPIFPQHHPLALGCLFFLPKPKRCKLRLPSQRPDQDNLAYAIRNAIKGVLCHDDDQFVWTAQPDGELWAAEEEPPGVLLTIIDLERDDSMTRYAGGGMNTDSGSVETCTNSGSPDRSVMTKYARGCRVTVGPPLQPRRWTHRRGELIAETKANGISPSAAAK